MRLRSSPLALALVASALLPDHSAAQVLQDGDLVISAHFSGGGRFFRLRGEALTILFESGASGIAFAPQGDLLIDSAGRIVFASGSCDGNQNNSNLLRWDPATGVLSQLLCIPRNVGAGGAPPGFPADIIAYAGVNGLHLTRSLKVSIDDDASGGAPQAGFVESYGFSMAVDRDPGPGPFTHEAFRYVVDDAGGGGHVEPGVALLLGNAGLGAEMFADSGATYYAAFHGDKIFRAQADLTIDVRARTTVLGAEVVVSGRLRIAGRNELAVGPGPGEYPYLDNTAIANVSVTCNINGQDVTDSNVPFDSGALRCICSLDSLGVLNGGIFATQSHVGAGGPWFFGLGPRDPFLNPVTCVLHTCSQGFGPYPFSADTPILAYTSVHNGRILGGDDGLADSFAVGRVFAVTPSGFQVLVEDPLLVRPRGVVHFPPETPALTAATLVVRVDSPVNVLVTDAAGRRIGHDAAGNTVNDFGNLGAILALGPEGHPRVYAVINPAEGDYALQAVGTGPGTYTIRGYRADTAAGGSLATISGDAAPGAVENLTLNLSPGLGLTFRRPCRADFNNDTFVNPDDLSDFITCFFLDIQFPATCPESDFNADGFRDPDDLSDFITAFFTSTC